MKSRLARYAGTALLLTGSAAAQPPKTPLPTVVLDQSDARYDEAKAGDLLYARPRDLHGIVAAPDSELTFFVWKWRSETPKSAIAAGKQE
jgi:hypothetical protein